MISSIHRWVIALMVCAGFLGSAEAFSQQINQGQAHSPEPVRVTATTTTALPSSTEAGSININTASEQELQRLPGVGPSRAAAIVALRQRVQRFRSPDDLMRVRGIGHASMRQMRPYVAITGETTLRERPARLVQQGR